MKLEHTKLDDNELNWIFVLLKNLFWHLSR